MTEPQTSQTNKVEPREAQVVEDESADRSGKVPLTARLLLHDSLTARRAAAIIAAFTVVITVAGGILERFARPSGVSDDRQGAVVRAADGHHRGVWGRHAGAVLGRFIATVVMLTGIGFLAVVTASVTASLVESSRRRFTAQSEADDTRQFDEITDRLARIEAALEQQASRRSPDAAS